MEISEDIVSSNEDVKEKKCVFEDQLNNEDLIYDDVYYNTSESPDTKPVPGSKTQDSMTPETTTPDENSVSGSSGKRTVRDAAVCLGLLSVLLLAGIIGQFVSYSNEKATLQGEKDKLQANLNNLMKAQNQQSCCLSGWKPNSSGSCFFTSNQNKTWQESRQDCLAKGADLVTIKSFTDQLFINGLQTEGRLYWIGLTDIVTEGNWTWVDKTNLTIPKYWASGNPHGNSTQNCVASNSIDNGKWVDYLCSSSLYWICKK